MVRLASASLWPVAAISTSFAAFTLMYFAHRRLQPEKSLEWSIRLVTMVHAGVVTTLAYFSCFALGPWPFKDPGLNSSAFNLAIISICLGYFIMDYLWCLKHGSEGIVMHVHHWFSLVYLTWGLYSRVSGAEIVGVIFGSEITNPMLQLRWMLKQCGKHDTGFGRINDMLFAVAFISIRCLVGAYFLYCVLHHPLPSMTVKVGGVVFYGISCVFSVQVMVFAKRKVATWRKHGRASPSENSSPKKDRDKVKDKQT